MDARLSSPSALRNRGPITDVLRGLAPARGYALEIASGTGEHAVLFGESLPGLTFQPSDPDPRHRASIDAWARSAGLSNVRPALDVDTTRTDWDRHPAIDDPLDLVICINMIHISAWEAGLGLLRGAGRRLRRGGHLLLYGPYRRGGEHTSDSNAAFDASLRQRDARWGVRDLEAVLEAAADAGLRRVDVVAMPANNLSVVLQREGDEGQRDHARCATSP